MSRTSGYWLCLSVMAVGCGQTTDVPSSLKPSLERATSDAESPGVSRVTSPESQGAATAVAADAIDEVAGQRPSTTPAPVSRPTVAASSAGSASSTAETFEQLQAQRERLDRTVWSPEVDAQRHEDRIVELWDALRARGNALEVWKAFPLETIVLRDPAETLMHDLDIRELRFAAGPNPRTLTQSEFHAWIDGLAAAGWQVAQTEWHHSQFARPADESARSIVSFAIDLSNQRTVTRATLRGTLAITWQDPTSDNELPRAKQVDASNVSLFVRDGELPFAEWHVIESAARYPRIMPLLLADLDGNGFSDVVLGGNNRILWNLGQGKLTSERLSSENLEIYDTAVLADFDGDTYVDLMCVDRQRYPLILAGDATGRFTRPSRRCADVQLTLPKTFTAGDVDKDGDLDVFIGQYKFAYQGGAMPTPFYDANDGDPAFLLINDGRGQFHDGTVAAGLTAKRNRRTYSASLADLDDDEDLDLLVISDYAGADLYLNDGTGKFLDATRDQLPDPHLFGMSHTLADFDGDLRLDIYAIGMSSTTARRLDALQLGPEDRPEINRMRSAMGYGNRLFLARDEGGARRFVRPEFADQVARTGWSWGTSSPDFDNDGDRDIYVVNGHSSGKSAKDYCTRFWCHDIYTGSSATNREVFKLFGESLKPLRRGEISWNGFEHNVLLMNERGPSFMNVGYLMGVADEFDSRGAASDDLDGDGRPDLLVIESRETPERTVYALHIVQNRLATAHHWIGLRLDQNVTGRSPIGARVECHAAGQRQLSYLVTGDSFSTQHAPVAHFGLGSATAVEKLTIRWANGDQMELVNPAIDQYHHVPSARSP